MSNNTGLNTMVGQTVIVRTYSAGVWFGILDEKMGDEVILKNARRMYRWFAAEGISLSECAMIGIVADKSRICVPVHKVWMEAIEIIPCTEKAAATLWGAPNAEQ